MALNRAKRGGLLQAWQAIVQAYSSFLAVPTFVIASFIAIAILMYVLDQGSLALLHPLRSFLQQHAFRSGGATSQLLSTIAGGLFTVTSITFSLLLLAVQQSATNLTSQVFDQFLRRTLNQVYIGYFVGLTLYTLIILVTVNKPHNPVLGASLDIVLTLAALYLLILIMYSTINQIRPTQVVESIHDLTLRARQAQHPLIRNSRRHSQSSHPVQFTFRAPRYGYLTDIHLSPVEQALAGTEAEVELLQPIGHFFVFGDAIARIRAPSRKEAETVGEHLASALQLQSNRSIRSDPSYGVEQLLVIGWTAISTAKQNLAPGQLVVRLLQDLVAHWSREELQSGHTIAMVYPDRLLSQTLDTLEALGSITAHSYQYQILAEIARAFAALFDSLPPELQRQSEEIILRLLPAVGAQLPTLELERAFQCLADTMRAQERMQVADAVEQAVAALNRSTGDVGSGSSKEE